MGMIVANKGWLLLTALCWQGKIKDKKIKRTFLNIIFTPDFALSCFIPLSDKPSKIPLNFRTGNHVDESMSRLRIQKKSMSERISINHVSLFAELCGLSMYIVRKRGTEFRKSINSS